MRARLKPILGTLVAIVLIWAIWVGLARGGQDFRVFHYAGKLALEGRWDALYREGPDRFLYAPGFAILISPLSAISDGPALVIWIIATVLAFGLAMRALANRAGPVPVFLAILFSIRALAIDLRYGQVNLLILSAAVWALLTWVERADARKSRRTLAAAWFIFGIAAFSKIYPLALFLFPVIALFGKNTSDRRSAISALVGASVGAALVVVPPLFISGVYPAWLDALARKGLPTDTHNQSLLATLVRVFGGESFYPLGLGGEALRFPLPVLSLGAARGIWIAFSIAVMGVLFFLAARKETLIHRRWLAASLGLALCFLPAHLIWKSYFVFGIPLLAFLFAEAERDAEFRRRIFFPSLALGIFLAFTSGDFVGPRAAAWIEAVSPFLWVHLAVATIGLFRYFRRDFLAS